MTSQLPAQQSRATLSALEELISKPMLLLDEDSMDFAGLHDALMRELSPATPYEQILAEDLARIQLEMERHHRLRDIMIRCKARDLAIGVFATGKIREVTQYDEEHRRSAIALIFGLAEERSAAYAALIAERVTPSELMAEAYAHVASKIELHEKKIAELGNRRRRLREDYDRLKATRREPVEDAEVVE